MMDWQDLHHFLSLASTGSLSGAARLLGVEHATVARRVAALEEAMGVRLVDRRGRQLMLTAEGERVAKVAMRMEAEAEGLARIRNGGSRIEGEVTLSVPPSYAAKRLMKPLAQVRAAHPGLRLRIIGETRYASLERREADIAVRLLRPDKGEFTLRRIDSFAMRLYGNPGYLNARASNDWDFIAYDETMDAAPQQRWLKARAGASSYALRASSLEMQAELARLGCGVAMLPDFLVAGDADLYPAEPEADPLHREVWMTVHSDIKDVPSIRVVLDALGGISPT
ncbi:MAG TPA: LysR family transcriptional regulator [Ensifer sp.]|nr:LysR family transcriptional regulator [Ensifer sp.]